MPRSNHLTVQPRYLTHMEHRSDISGDKIIDTCNIRRNKSSNMTSKKELNSNGCTSVNTTTTYTNSSSMRMSESHFSCETNCFNKYSPLSQNFKEKSNSETASTSSSDSFSFIVQRVERLYGPGALAQGFYTRNKTQFSPPSQEREREEEYHNDNTESLPVLKLLRPEFRAQLSLAKRKSSLNQRNNDSNGEAKERIIPIAIEQDLSEPDATVKEREVINPPSQKDGHFYLQLVCNEMKTLERLASDIETELENQVTVPEDIAGRLRAAAGKARLLASQKLSQFKGLCQKNINQDTSEDFPTTCEDLAGFWDMVSIQINSVHEEFDKINKLKASGWTKDSLSDDDKSSKVSTNGTTPTHRSKGNSKINASAVKTNIGKTSNASKARDEERKRLIEERRKAMKKNLNSGANNDTVFVLAE